MSDLLNPDLQDEADVQRAIAAYGAAPGVGSAAGGVIGGVLGTLIPIPGVGTALGASIGSGVGGLIGSGVATLGQGAEQEKLKQLQAARLGPDIEKQARYKAFQDLLGSRSNFK